MKIKFEIKFIVLLDIKKHKKITNNADGIRIRSKIAMLINSDVLACDLVFFLDNIQSIFEILEFGCGHRTIQFVDIDLNIRIGYGLLLVALKLDIS